MNKVIGVILLVAGVYLLIRGHDISRSVTGQLQSVANKITGDANSKAMPYYLGGAAACAVGLVSIFFWSSKK